MIRAVLFDLDDTLYPERDFVVSGFAAVARECEARGWAPCRDSYAVLCAALRAGRRATALQALCEQYGIAFDRIPGLVDVIRSHTPALRLPGESLRALVELRGRYRLGIVTNGLPAIQSRKVTALGLHRLVDAVVFASEHGTRSGKPDPAAFLEAAARLQVVPRACAVVGNDPDCDIAGARRAGMKSIRAGAPAAAGESDEADVVVSSMAEVPAAIARLERTIRRQRPRVPRLQEALSHAV